MRKEVSAIHASRMLNEELKQVFMACARSRATSITDDLYDYMSSDSSVKYGSSQYTALHFRDTRQTLEAKGSHIPSPRLNA